MVMSTQPGFPDNWKDMTPEQKRQWRLDYFIRGEGIQFISREAKEAYQVRARRFADAYSVQEPDRVPVILPVGDLPYLQYGINIHTAMYEIQKAIAACKQFNTQYSEELEYFASPGGLIPAKALEILDYKLYAWPGHGLSKDAPGHQFLESEYMKAEEYDELILDPSNFWLRTYLPRAFGTLNSYQLLDPLTSIVEIPMGKLEILANPQIKATLRKLLEAGDEMEMRNRALAQMGASGPASGYPAFLIPSPSRAPFDLLGDTLRGTASIMKDMYRRPDKVLAACEKIADFSIENLLAIARNPRVFHITFPLHKGADGWMSQKQFDTFYFPTLKRVMDALINEGITVTLFAEGSYNTRLESVNVFPKGSVCWHFDQSDMIKAKKILGDKCCLHGNVPASLIVTGSPQDVKECCRKLIENCGQGGGYILGAGCTAENPRLENLRAMISAAKEYGTYNK
jgi:hypothetical protein